MTLRDSDLPDQIDVAIVGGGIIGVACAWRLALLGAHVAVFEQREIGTGASLRNAGQMRFSKCTPLAAPGAMHDAARWLLKRHAAIRVLPYVTPNQILWLRRFAQATREPLAPRERALASLGHLSADLFADFSRVHERDCLGTVRGALDVYETVDGFASALSEQTVTRANGFDCEGIGPEEARSLEPMLSARIAGATWFPGDTCVDPERLLAALADEAREAGALLFAARPVERLLVSGGRVEGVIVEKRCVNARNIVLACGHAVGELTRPLGLYLPVTTGKGYTVDLIDAGALRLPAVFVEQHTAATPLAGSIRVAGGMVVGARSHRMSTGVAAALERRVRRVLPGLAEPTGRTLWAGLRPLSPDGLPIIGPFLGFANLAVATGHGMLGLTHALGTGELIASWYAGSPSDPQQAAFSPDRFCDSRLWGGPTALRG